MQGLVEKLDPGNVAALKGTFFNQLRPLFSEKSMDACYGQLSRLSDSRCSQYIRAARSPRNQFLN